MSSLKLTNKQKAIKQKYFGMLEVLGQSTHRQDSVTTLCSCGHESDINVYSILYGLRTSCGCHKRPKLQEVLEVKRYSKLTVIGRGKTVSVVNCLCDCGVEKEIPIVRLLNGDSKTCGCRIGTVTNKMRCIDLKVFGRLTVLGASKDCDKVSCKCDCGTIKDVATSSLLNNDTRSCGCLSRELAIKRGYDSGTMYVGYRNKSTKGDWFEVVNYKNCDVVTIRFDCNRYETTASAGNVRKGEVRNVFRKKVCGIGYFGEGQFTSKDKAYTHWGHMISRCYSDNYGETYKNAFVDERWHNYQIFALWFHANWVGNLDVALDKDLLVKGNRIYSEDTCSLVPENLNNFTCTSDAIRGESPLGTTNSNGKTIAQIYVYGCHETIGLFCSEQEAFNAYKKRKEEVARIYADDYFSKGLIQEKLRDALYNYKVSIDD